MLLSIFVGWLTISISLAVVASKSSQFSSQLGHTEFYASALQNQLDLTDSFFQTGIQDLKRLRRNRTPGSFTSPNGDYSLVWNAFNASLVMITMSARTQGWVGFGLMAGANGHARTDMIQGWVNDTNGLAFVLDGFSSRFGPPVPDNAQDVILLYGSQNNGKTTISLLRKIDSGDAQDIAFAQNRGQRFVWAYGTDDNFAGTQHATNARGRSIANFAQGLILNLILFWNTGAVYTVAIAGLLALYSIVHLSYKFLKSVELCVVYFCCWCCRVPPRRTDKPMMTPTVSDNYVAMTDKANKPKETMAMAVRTMAGSPVEEHREERDFEYRDKPRFRKESRRKPRRREDSGSDHRHEREKRRHDSDEDFDHRDPRDKKRKKRRDSLSSQEDLEHGGTHRHDKDHEEEHEHGSREKKRKHRDDKRRDEKHREKKEKRDKKHARDRRDKKDHKHGDTEACETKRDRRKHRHDEEEQQERKRKDKKKSRRHEDLEDLPSRRDKDSRRRYSDEYSSEEHGRKKGRRYSEDDYSDSDRDRPTRRSDYDDYYDRRYSYEKKVKFSPPSYDLEGKGEEMHQVQETAVVVQMDSQPKFRSVNPELQTSLIVLEKGRRGGFRNFFTRSLNRRIFGTQIKVIDSIIFSFFLFINLGFLVIWRLPFYQDIGPNLGYLAAANSFFVMLPATRNSLLLLLMDMPFDRSIMFHRWVGDLVFYLSTAHFLYYLIIAGLAGNLNDLYQFPKYMTGTLAWIFLALMYVTSFAFIRRCSFNFFYTIHFLFIGYYIAASYHSAAFVPFSIAAGIIWIADRLWRSFSGACPGRTTEFSLVSENVVRVRFPRSCLSRYTLGQYLFINFPGISLLQWHPYTISSGPDEPDLEINIRGLGDHTRRLIAAAKESRSVLIRVDGPYGKWPYNYARYPRLIFAGAGIGITPCIAAIRHIFQFNVLFGRRQPIIKEVLFVWSVREMETFNIFKNVIEQCKAKSGNDGFPLFNCQIYLTKECAEKSPDLLMGRPIFNRIFGDFLSESIVGYRIGVVASGPKDFTNEVWDACSSYTRKNYRFDFHHDTFEF